MRAVFRVDASVEMGIGHVMRCLTLADALSGKGVESVFVCNRMEGDMTDAIRRKGYLLHGIPVQSSNTSFPLDQLSDAEMTLSVLKSLSRINWLIVDHYDLDYLWEERVRPFVEKIMVVDDLADRGHDCDILLDQNLHERKEKRYDALVPTHCKKLFGPEYALLRPEFLDAGKGPRERKDKVERILISFGGSDLSNETCKVLRALKMLNRSDIPIDVVVGPSNSHKAEIESLSSTIPNSCLQLQTTKMAELMRRADLCVGGGGTTTWERCCLGLPSLVISVAENQEGNAGAVHARGAGINLGRNDVVGPDQISRVMEKLLNDAGLVHGMSLKASEIVDGRGCDRVTQAMISSQIHLRQVRNSDARLLWKWANDPLVRRVSFNSDTISYEEHRQWFSRKACDPNCHHFICETPEGRPIGQIRFEMKKGAEAEISYSLEEEHRGIGLGKDLLLRGIQCLLSRIVGSVTIKGWVKESNVSSMKVFDKAGFTRAVGLASPGVCLYEKKARGLES